MALMWLGNAVLDQGELLLAHTQYERAYRTNPQHPTVINNYAQSLVNLGRYDDVSDLLAGTTEDRAVLRHLQAKLALEKRDWLTVVRLAEALRRDGDVLNADLTMWRLETARGNTSAAESYLDHAAQVDVADHKVFLAVLEHLAGASNSLAFQGILDHWEVVDDSHEYHAKLTFSRGAWQGIGQAARGEYELALRTFSTLLENQPASIEPSFRLMLVGHTLAAAQALGDSQAYSHWRDLGLDWTATAERAGWASFEFRLQQGLFLAAAIEPDAAQSAFLAASELGELPAQQIRNDPRALPLISSGELAEFI